MPKTQYVFFFLCVQKFHSFFSGYLPPPLSSHPILSLQLLIQGINRLISSSPWRHSLEPFFSTDHLREHSIPLYHRSHIIQVCKLEPFLFVLLYTVSKLTAKLLPSWGRFWPLFKAGYIFETAGSLAKKLTQSQSQHNIPR